MEMTRYYENMKPRFNNPTYNSSNVGSSLGSLLASPVSGYHEEPIKTLNKDSQYNSNPKTLQQTRHKSYSGLSNYGTHSLSSLPKQISDRDIYQKQSKKYNIISIKPIEHQQTIRKYPKYHLENMDINFYKKLKLESQYAQTRFKNQNNNKISNQYVSKESLNQPKENPQKNHYADSKNHQEYQNKNQNPYQSEATQRANQHQIQRQNFRAKMLNNVDELQGVL